MAETKVLYSELPILARGEAERRVRRVLFALAAVAVVFLGTIGLGLRFLADEIQNSVAMAGVIRNANFISNVLAGVDLAETKIEGLSLSENSNLGTEQFKVLWAELRRGAAREFRRMNSNGIIIESSKQGEVGARLPETALAQLRSGQRLDTRIDLIKGSKLQVGVAMSYVPLFQDGNFVGGIGVWADRTADSKDALRQLQAAYALLAMVFLGFCVPTGVFLRRYLLQRFSIENELALQTNELLLGETVAQIGYWSMSPRSEHVNLSGEAERLIGMTPGGVKATLSDFSGLFNLDDKDRISSGLHAVLEGALKEFQIETSVVIADGTMHDLRLVAQRRLDGDEASLFGVVVDITTEKSARRTLNDSQEKLRLLTDNASDIISFYDKNRILRYVSPSVTRISGYTQEEVLGHDTFEVVHPDDVRGLLERRGLVGGQSRPNAESATWRLRRKDGTYIWMESSVTIIDALAGDFQVVSIARDITERVEREAELHEAQDQLRSNADDLRLLATELEIERQRAEQANAAKSQFLATMSHELRTPMTGVIGMAELLLGSTRSPEQEKQLRMLTHSARILVDLLNEILDLSKIESGKFELESIDFLLSETLQEVQQLVWPAVSEKNLVLEIAPRAGAVDAVCGDPKRLRQVLLNLVGNAIKFTTRGSVKLSATQRVVGSDVHLVFDITDTGIGLSPSERERLFQPFTQADASTARRFGGTGLGLTISKHFAEAMDGDIAVVSEKGKGSTFTLSVKLRKATRDVAARRVAAIKVAEAPLQPLRILLAEDTDTTRYLVTSMLSRQGHSVVAVVNGELAIQAVANDVFDLALIDMHMPVVDGTEAIRAIRALPSAASRMPIIALTADIIADHIAGYIRCGANVVIGKPIDWPQLFEEIARLTRPHPHETAAPASRPAPSSARQLDGLNPVMLDEIEGMLGPDGLKKLLAKFSVNIGSYRDTLLAAHASGDRKAVTAAAHALRGVASQFGAEQLSVLAQRIEERQGNPADIDAVKPDLIRAVNSAMGEAERRSAA